MIGSLAGCDWSISAVRIGLVIRTADPRLFPSYIMDDANKALDV